MCCYLKFNCYCLYNKAWSERKLQRVWVKMGPRVYETGHHKWYKSSGIITDIACDGLYYFLANHTAKMVTYVILQSIIGKNETEACKTFCEKYNLGTDSAGKI